MSTFPSSISFYKYYRLLVYMYVKLLSLSSLSTLRELGEERQPLKNTKVYNKPPTM